MKVRIIKPFIDSETNELRIPNKVHEVTAKRGKVLIEKGAAIEVPEAVHKPESKDADAE